MLLAKIRDKVGMVENPVYVYGLIDREEYQLPGNDQLSLW